jgi:hypothetical protein
MQLIITGEYDEIADFIGLCNTSSEDVTTVTREELIEELVKLEYKIKNDLSKVKKEKKQ